MKFSCHTVPVVTSLFLLYRDEKLSICLSVCLPSVLPSHQYLSHVCNNQNGICLKCKLSLLRPQSIYIYKSKNLHLQPIFSATFSKVSVARNVNIVPFDCLLGWHAQVYLQIFLSIALFLICSCAQHTIFI